LSELPNGTDLGYFHMILKDELKGFALNNKYQSIQGSNLLIEEGNNVYLTNDNAIKVTFTRNDITFNINQEYLGWDNYFTRIQSILKLLFDRNIITKVNRIGLRYISQFDNIAIHQNINGNINLDFVEGDIYGMSRFELYVKEFIVLLTLTNKQQVPENISKADYISIVDVDVVKVFNQLINDYEQVIRLIDEAHSIEKEVFFTLLKQGFLQTLNPKY
jgi:uncharacterized protein (TIGR04255 family)